MCLSVCRTSICCRQSVTRIHGFLEVTSPPAPLPPLGGWSQGHASFKLTDFSGRYKATNQSHYRWLIKQPWWMVRLQTIHLLLHQIGDNTFSSETAREIKTPVNCEELSLRLIRCSAFKDALNSELNIVKNNASIARCLAKIFKDGALPSYFDTVMSSVRDVQCLCHQLAVPTFSSASPLVSDSLPFPECLSTAPREWAGTCWYHSKVGVHRPANSLKLCSVFGCRGVYAFIITALSLAQTQHVPRLHCSVRYQGWRGRTGSSRTPRVQRIGINLVLISSLPYSERVLFFA